MYGEIARAKGVHELDLLSCMFTLLPVDLSARLEITTFLVPAAGVG